MMKITEKDLKGLYRPPKESHKGQNGKLCIIGGSRLFHGASLWALKIASRVVDMVFYSTVEENEELTKKLKSEIYDFICVPREKIEAYIEESDAVLIGPGLTREPKRHLGGGEDKVQNWEDTDEITCYFLGRFPDKKWIIDAGSLQMMSADWLKELANVIITPHRREFCQLFKCKMQSASGGAKCKIEIKNSKLVSQMAKDYGCTIVLKGPVDIVCSSNECGYNTTGNEGMTKGGTGDVLAGLIAALACKNDLFLASCAGVYINGIAADRLYKKVGPYFNASDLCDEVARVMKEVLGY